MTRKEFSSMCDDFLGPIALVVFMGVLLFAAYALSVYTPGHDKGASCLHFEGGKGFSRCATSEVICYFTNNSMVCVPNQQQPAQAKKK